MELVKQTLARFEYKDIVLLVRTRGTVGDELLREAILANVKSAKVVGDLPRIGRDLVRMFVVGWEGVTQDGKPVVFNPDLIYSAFPADLTNTMMPALYQFIAKNVDILK